MRIWSFSFIMALLIFSPEAWVDAQANIPNPFDTNLSFGSKGPQVMALQKLLNRDPDTRVATTGLGSPGNETSAFGSLTRAAILRFQAKYANDVLVPAGLSQGNGYVGSYTRTKLNALSLPVATGTHSENTPVATTPVATTTPVPTDYLVQSTEKTDIYAGDAMIARVQTKLFSSINTSIISASASRNTATITPPTISTSEIPSVTIGIISPQSGTAGTNVSLTGSGISSRSVVYFGNTYIVRAIDKDLFGNMSFVVPSIPPGLYDIAVKTDSSISNTKIFVILDPKSPPVHLQSVSPSVIKYGDTITLTGSGFSPTDNIVITRFQKFTHVASPDGKTLRVSIAPENLQGSAKVGNGTRSVVMSVSVVNAYGFSDSEKSFTMSL